MTTNLSIQPNPSASSEDQTFHPFPRLPLELRQIIWSHTFIPRVIRFCLSRNPPSWELDPELCTYGASICTPPLTFTINRESRSYALTRYIKISVSDSSPVDRRCWVAPKYAWFNRDIDVLYAVTPTDLLHPQIMKLLRPSATLSYTANPSRSSARPSSFAASASLPERDSPIRTQYHAPGHPQSPDPANRADTLR